MSVHLCKNFNKATLYEDMVDHRSYKQNLSSCEIKVWKNTVLNGIRTDDPTIRVPCSTNWAISHLGVFYVVSS